VALWLFVLGADVLLLASSGGPVVAGALAAGAAAVTGTGAWLRHHRRPAGPRTPRLS
jgi:hypothetical protein